MVAGIIAFDAIGGEVMATSSIFAEITIDTPEAADQFLTAIEQSAADEGIAISVPYADVHGDAIREMFCE